MTPRKAYQKPAPKPAPQLTPAGQHMTGLVLETSKATIQDLLALPSVSIQDLSQLPAVTAVYAVMVAGPDPASPEVLYVGKANNLLKRWTAHHKLAALFNYPDAGIAWKAGSKDDCGQTEVGWYLAFHPKFNLREPVFEPDWDSVLPEYRNEMNREIEEWCGKASAAMHRMACQDWDRRIATKKGISIEEVRRAAGEDSGPVVKFMREGGEAPLFVNVGKLLEDGMVEDDE